jgi:hypothetical protein
MNLKGKAPFPMSKQAGLGSRNYGDSRKTVDNKNKNLIL